jgi:hypothetical protein
MRLQPDEWIIVPGQHRIRGNGGLEFLIDTNRNTAIFYKIGVDFYVYSNCHLILKIRKIP